MADGKVWLVGAGPGDCGLLTVKGARLLAQAQVVVYDALVGADILAQIPESAERIYVGKRANCHVMSQEEINRCLISRAGAGRRVVRLKGGDPFLFARGGEEAEALMRAGISYEIIPGVSSALAVPAYNGIPVTHRDYSSSVHIFTGHRKAGETLHLDFDALCRTGGTYIFLMGLSAVSEICEGLLSAGMAPDTPAALLSRGTTAAQKRLSATLGTMAGELAKHSLPAPAVFVVGGVCGLADQLDWYRKLPLFGCKVLVTSPRVKDRSTGLVSLLREQGAEVLEYPTVYLKPYEDNARLMEALAQIEQFTWIAFTSPSAVDIFFDQCRKIELDFRRFGGFRFAVTGPGTRERLALRGIYADVMPKVFSGKELGRLLAGQLKDSDCVLLPQSEQAQPGLLQELAAGCGARICAIPLYESVLAESGWLDLAHELEGPEESLVVFTSRRTVLGFVSQAKHSGLDLSRVRAVCIGLYTYQEAERQGMDAYMSDCATAESLVDKIFEIMGESRGIIFK